MTTALPLLLLSYFGFSSASTASSGLKLSKAFRIEREAVELEKEYFFVRLRCLQLADSLFQRSHAFRVLLLKVSQKAD